MMGFMIPNRLVKAYQAEVHRMELAKGFFAVRQVSSIIYVPVPEIALQECLWKKGQLLRRSRVCAALGKRKDKELLDEDVKDGT